MDLVDVGLPGIGRVAVAVVAGIVTLGVLGAYVGAFAKLGASLGRDGDLPRWVAQRAQPGGVPRRALLVVAGLAALYFGIAVATGGTSNRSCSCTPAAWSPSMRSARPPQCGCSNGAAPAGGAAVAACGLALVLAALAGWHLVVPVGLALVAVGVGVLRPARVSLSR